MATPKDAIRDIKALTKKLAKNEAVSTTELRDIIDKQQIHILTLRDEELNILHDLIDNMTEAEIKSVTKDTAVSTVKQLAAPVASVAEGGQALSIETFERLRAISRIVNSNPASDDEYDLGHEHSGVLTLLFKLQQQHHRFHDDPAKAARQKLLIDNALKVATTLDNLSDEELIKISKKKGTTVQLKDVIALAGKASEFNVKAETALLDNLQTGRLGTVVHVRLENRTLNRLKGRIAKDLKGKLDKALSEATFTKADKQLLAEAMFAGVDGKRLHASPSIEDRFNTLMLALFTGKKLPKTRRDKNRTKSSEKIQASTSLALAKKLKSRIRSRTKLLKTKLAATKGKTAFAIPTITLKAIINESLAEFIRNRMGDSDDPPILLRNQTGTFSRSARLLTLTRTQAGAYLGTYEFEQNPYGVFLPGARLGTQQRDPKLYIEGAARDIALQVLKNNFKGLYLELK